MSNIVKFRFKQNVNYGYWDGKHVSNHIFKWSMDLKYNWLKNK